MAWSTVVGKRSKDVSADLRRRALATTVLRISADGRLDRDDQQQEIADDDAETEAEGHQGVDREDDAARSGAKAFGLAKPSQTAVGSVHGAAPRSPSPAATDRSDVGDRLGAVRKRFAVKHVNTRASRVEVPRPRATRSRPPVRRKSEIRTLVQRLLIGLAIVGASVVVSILVT